MAERELAGEAFAVRIMPTPSEVRGGCGFCLRLALEDVERAAALLSRRGFADAEAHLRVETGGAASYRKIDLGNR